MATQVTIRRGTLAQTNAFTGANGEITFSFDTKSLHIHDGLTAGGIKLSKESELIAANTALTTLVNDRLQVANAAVYAEVANVQSLSALANTNSAIASKLDSSSYTTADVQTKAALGNTNAFIATKLNTSSYTTADVQDKAALANTNAAIATKLASSSYTTGDVQTKAALANTNAAIATKLASSSYTTGDVQTKAALANTNSFINTVNTRITTEITNIINAAPESLNTLNELAAALGDDPNLSTTLTTNIGQKLGKTATVTLTGDVTASATAFSGNAVSLTTTDTNLANTNAFIATKLNSSSYTTGDVQDKAALANTNSAIADRMQVANTNTLVNDRLQVANATLQNITATGATTDQVITITSSGTDASLILTNTDDSSTAAPVQEFYRNSASPANGDYLGQLKFQGESDSGSKRVYAKITSKIKTVTDGNEAGLIETVVREDGSNKIVSRLNGDELQTLNGVVFTENGGRMVSNAHFNATYTTGDVQTKAALGNTNAFIATKLNTSSYTTGDVQDKAALANTNAFIATKLNSSSYTTGDVQDKAALANTNAFIATKLNSSSYTTGDVQDKAALANTNSAIATKLASSSYTTGDVQTKAALGNTNAFIATKLNSSSYTTADVQTKAALGNTNAFIATKLNSSSYTTGDVQTKAALANTNSYIATTEGKIAIIDNSGTPELKSGITAAEVRSVIGAGTSSFSGNYSDLSGPLEVYNAAGTKLFP